jgi:hypothetical protein
MKKFMQSPIGAGLLIIAALAFVYSNLIAPMMSGGSSTTYYEEEYHDYNEYDDESALLFALGDSVAGHKLRSISWKRMSNRNPFRSENRSGPIASWLISPTDSIPELVQSRPTAPLAPIYRGFAAAGNDTIALLGGRVVRKGDSTWYGIIQSIHEQEIRFMRDGSSFTLPFVRGNKP